MGPFIFKGDIMNLVETYSKHILFGTLGPYRMLRVVAAPGVTRNYPNTNLLNVGKVYEVSKVTKCNDSFNCYKSCTTKGYHFTLFDMHPMINKRASISGCEYEFESVGGLPLILK